MNFKFIGLNLNNVSKNWFFLVSRTLHDAEAKVKVIISKRFDEAVDREDLASVERFFKIFPLINMHEEGLKKFTNYLCAKVNCSSTILKV